MPETDARVYLSAAPITKKKKKLCNVGARKVMITAKNFGPITLEKEKERK